MILMEDWARRESNVVRAFGFASTSFAQWLNADPDRYSLVISTNATQIVWILFGKDQSQPASLFISGNTSFVTMDIKDYGQIVTESVWIKTTSGTPGVTVTSLSYTPNRKAVLDRHYERAVSYAPTL